MQTHFKREGASGIAILVCQIRLSRIGLSCGVSCTAVGRNALRPIAEVPHDSETDGRMERLTEESRMHTFDM
jgi:hypothetical protein